MNKETGIMKLTKKRGELLCFAILSAILALTPVLLRTGMIESSSTVIFLGKCMAFAVAAIGLDLIWGYTGILSLGHGLWFVLGAYGMAMYLKMDATGGRITEFMHTGGLSELPLVWKPFLSLPPTIVMMVAAPAVLSGLVGYFIFKNRVKGVYFSIISQALTWAGYSMFIALSPYTNGNVGITEIKSVFGSIRGGANQSNLFLLFYTALAVLVAVYALSSVLVETKFGKLLVAIRDGENRTYFSGYNVCLYKNFVYMLSSVMAAFGGAVFVNFNGSITPSQMTIAYSINMVIWVAVGGRGTIIGAVLGAFLINLCEYNLSSGGMVEVWQYVVGGIFCVTILFFKGGIVGLFKEQLPGWMANSRKRGGGLCAESDNV